MTQLDLELDPTWPYERELIRRLGPDCLPAWLALNKYGAPGGVAEVMTSCGLSRSRARFVVMRLWQGSHLELIDQPGSVVQYRAVRWQPRVKDPAEAKRRKREN